MDLGVRIIVAPTVCERKSCNTLKNSDTVCPFLAEEGDLYISMINTGEAPFSLIVNDSKDL